MTSDDDRVAWLHAQQQQQSDHRAIPALLVVKTFYKIRSAQNYGVHLYMAIGFGFSFCAHILLYIAKIKANGGGNSARVRPRSLRACRDGRERLRDGAARGRRAAPPAGGGAAGTDGGSGLGSDGARLLGSSRGVRRRQIWSLSVLVRLLPVRNKCARVSSRVSRLANKQTNKSVSSRVGRVERALVTRHAARRLPTAFATAFGAAAARSTWRVTQQQCSTACVA